MGFYRRIRQDGLAPWRLRVMGKGRLLLTTHEQGIIMNMISSRSATPKDVMVMTQKETEEYIKDMKKFTKKVSASKNKSKAFLEKTGVYSRKGNLNQHYK
jgi:hypothetical protein